MELFNTHKNRLVIEQDANMLANRISMLQQEEAKIMKKINQTRKRADEIMKTKQRNDEMFAKRMRDREMAMQMEEQNRQKYFNDRVQRQHNKERTIKAIKKAKNEEFKAGKSMTLQNDAYKRDFLDAVKRQNEEKRLQVQEEEKERAEKLRQLEEEKLKENQEKYLQRVEEERARILDQEKKIKQMEKMEAELLNRLKNSQQMEQAEYGNLEKALKESTQACEERRKKITKIRKPRPKELAKMRHSLTHEPSEKSSAHRL
jgi:hypothetical protein